jgi:hypothetical protein
MLKLKKKGLKVSHYGYDIFRKEFWMLVNLKIGGFYIFHSFLKILIPLNGEEYLNKVSFPINCNGNNHGNKFGSRK